MILAMLDTETTGLDLKKDKMTEFGVAIIDMDSNTPLFMYGSLTDPGILIGEDASRISGITNKMVKGKSLNHEMIVEEVSKADYIVAHNAFFDMSFVINEFKDIDGGKEAFDPERWLDTLLLVDWKRLIPDSTSLRINYIAADLGVINPFAHRALTDALLLAQIINREIVYEMIQKATCEWVQVRAINAPFDAKDELKSERYRARYSSGGKFMYWYKNLPDINTNLDAELHFLSEHVYPRQMSIRVNKLGGDDREEKIRNHPASIKIFKKWYYMASDMYGEERV